ncbi:hypothetical protein [uncultured Phycicoccus sp.]|uniref:hypothetical protein n=1 Tax=uncultured Phycicoccus sp. TaxID=661422 RepID=UPI00261BFF24|nr:hypothetical protein [uncultured Phycicoccus sp.]
MSQSTSAAAPVRVRRRMEPARKRLLLAALMALVGAFLPWLYTGVGNINGARGAGLWVAYAAVFGVAGALMPMRRVSAVQAAVLAAVALALPIWQLVHLAGLVGFEGWMPGPGIIMCLGGGVLAAVAGRQLWQPPAQD